MSEWESEGTGKQKKWKKKKMIIYRKNNGIEDSEWEIDGFEKPK